MKPRAAALALAAPLLFTAPALADPGSTSKSVHGSLSIQTENGGLTLSLGDRRYGSYSYSSDRYYGHRGYQSDRQYRRAEKRQAIRACRRAIRAEAGHRGFHDVDFDDGRYAERIGPRGFRVTFNEVEFEGRRRDIERPVTCIVRRGDQVREIYGIPERRNRGHRRGHRSYY
nr:hypothetical protein [Hyphomonas sp. Mor2]